MNRPPVLVAKPESLPVKIASARAFPGIGADVSEERLADMIETAAAELDGYSGILGRTLISQTWRKDFATGCGPFRLPFPNVSDATAVWRAEDGSEAPAAIVLDEDVIGPFVRHAGGWGGARGAVLRVTFTCGYGPEPKAVPAPIREAILRSVAQTIIETSEDGQIRSFSADGAFTEAYNSPEQRAAETARTVRGLLKPYRRGNVL